MQEQQNKQSLSKIQAFDKQILKTYDFQQGSYQTYQQLKNQLFLEEIQNNIEQSHKFKYITFKDNNKSAQCSQLKKKNKNEKKKERKKRNKIHKFKIKQQKIQQLKLVLAEIYQNNQRIFEIKQSQILSIIENLPQQQIFFQILNHAINQYIDRSAQSIWYRLDQYINCDPEDFLLDCPEQWPEFFKILINQLYSQYEAIKRSSANIEKVIEAFIKYYSKKSQSVSEDQNYNLTKNTFNHLISSNVFFERFMKSCKNFLAYTNNPDERTNKQSMQKLKQLLEVFDPSLNSQDQECEQYQQVCFDSQNSTQQQYNIKQDSNKTEKKKRKRNRKKEKNKQEQVDAEVICICKNQQTHFQKTLEFLDKLALETNRVTCEVSQLWIRQIQNKFKDKKKH